MPARLARLGLLLGAVVALVLPATVPADTLPADALPAVRFGVIADPQYAPVPPRGSRYYGNSLWKLSEAVEALNQQDLAFVVTLGDIIDRHVDSYTHILPLYQRLRHENHYALGNHEFSVGGDYVATVPAYLGMKQRYYAFSKGGVRFLVTDGNDTSLYATVAGSPAHDHAQEALAALKEKGAVNAMTWNGGLSAQQMDWLRGQLTAAKTAGERVILFSHFPVWPEDVHNLWNDRPVRQLLAEYDHVIAWMNGHNHGGHYGATDGIHYITVEGMVETAAETAWAVVEVYDDRLVVQGTGRATCRDLPIPAAPSR
jgi:hypothetical protein